ncbi:MAG: Ig-like domain-containing protein [Vulcanimicrobiota bacterium]
MLAAPVAVADEYTVNANTILTVLPANGVLVNDTVNGATPTFATTTDMNGTITGLSDGTFTYSPPLDFFGTDSFTYTLTNSAGTSTTTVTITVAAVNAFIVDAATGDDTTGNFINGPTDVRLPPCKLLWPPPPPAVM